MARLHKEYIGFNRRIKLTDKRKEELITSRNALRGKIENYFEKEKPDELQPTFDTHGSFDLDTVVNPIIEYDKDGNELRKYDLDDGVYFVEIKGEDNRQEINTWHNWVYNAVKDHTSSPPIKKDTCIRIVFSDGHNIDLPIRYQTDDGIEFAHKSKGWVENDPKEFAEWFKNQVNGAPQLRRIIRYAKAWKNFREWKNSSLNFPSGFALTILATVNYQKDEFDDVAFRKTMEKIQDSLKEFKCLRPTTPKDEDLFSSYSDTRRDEFLNALDKLVEACQKADEESNFMEASQHLQKHFGDRYPNGKDESTSSKASRKSSLIGMPLASKPYCE